MCDGADDTAHFEDDDTGYEWPFQIKSVESPVERLLQEARVKISINDNVNPATNLPKQYCVEGKTSGCQCFRGRVEVAKSKYLVAK